MFDVTSKEFAQDLEHYESCLQALTDLSSKSKIFCLVHKMDLVPDAERESRFIEKRNRIMDVTKPEFKSKLECFKTSIWDETLYKAWSTIVSIMIPNIVQLRQSLEQVCKSLNANEIVLFEKSTFLVISHFDAKNHEDVHRFEKISNIIKQFKLSCIKTNYKFVSMVVRNEKFNAMIDEFTSSTYIMVIYSDTNVEQEAVSVNLKASRPYFESIVQS